MRYIFVAFFIVVASHATLAQPSATPSWKLYYDSAQVFWGKDWKKTIPLLSHAEQSALNDLGIYDENYLTIINDLGLAYAQNRDYINAEKILSKGIAIKNEINAAPDATLYRSMINLGGVHAEQGHIPQAEQLFKKVLASGEVEREIYLSAAKNLVLLYEGNNETEKALQTLDSQKGRLNTETRSNPVEEYELALIRGRINRKLRKYEDARIILEPIVRDLYSQTNPKLSSIYIQSLQETGLLYFEMGSFNKAEKNLLQGFRLLKSQQPVDEILLTELLNNLASVYERLGIYDKAMAYYQESLELCNRLHGRNSLSAVTIQSNIAGIQLKQENLKQAITHYEEVLTILKSLVQESNPFYITVLNNLATAYRKNNQYKEASARLDQAYKLLVANKLENDDLAATVMNNQAVLLTAHGEPDKAIVYYEKAYNIKKAIYGDNSVLLTDLASNMAVVYWALHKPDLAIPLFQKSISLAIRQIKYTFPGLSEAEQVQFYKKLKEDFERFNTIALESMAKRQDLVTQVFNNQITIKSLLFFSQQHQHDLIYEKGDSTLIKQYELLKAKREQLGYLYQLSLKAQSSINTPTASLEKEIETLEKNITLKTSESIAAKTAEQSVQWKDLQSKIQPDEALVDVIRFRKYDVRTYKEDNQDRVSFGFTDSIYYAMLITTHETVASPQLVLVREGRNMETRFLNYYRNALIFEVADENSYPHYWKPFEGRLQGKTKIFFAGDGVYHQLNLNIFRNSSKNQYLIQQYDIHYLLNPAQFLEQQKQSFGSKRAILFGDPVFDTDDDEKAKSRDTETSNFASLPGTNTEILKIDEILKGKTWTTSVYLKRLANEKNLKSIHSPDILHIATHGFFSADRVTLNADSKKDFLFYSGLVLSGANRNINEQVRETHDDGIITAYEVMNLDLSKTHLVVLSACETGLGRIENGEGVFGLQRSFLQAGARNIMISLWKVDDNATQQLMISFYQYLFQGRSEHDALKLAQLDQMKRSPNPMNWGGFILVGAD